MKIASGDSRLLSAFGAYPSINSSLGTPNARALLAAYVLRSARGSIPIALEYLAALLHSTATDPQPQPTSHNKAPRIGINLATDVALISCFVIVPSP